MKNNKDIAVLFARRDSIYKQFPNCDVYDIDRNALNFPGGMPVIAHPPCRAWGRLRHFANPRPGEKELALFALDMIRKNGGILEHPASSTLWKEMNLPVGQDVDKWGGWTMSINQHWFGHLAEKKTWLYIVGIKPSEISDYSISFSAITHTVSSSKSKIRNKKEISKKMREETPEQFAQWLIENALLIKHNYNHANNC